MIGVVSSRGGLMKRPGKAGGKAADVRRPKAAGRKRRAVPKAKSQPRFAAGPHEQLERNRQELNEALQQQAATSEVLRLISAAPGDLQRVFSVILESATRLCQANFGTLYLFEADSCRVVAMHNAPPALAEFRRRDPVVTISGASLIARVAKRKRTIQVADIWATPAARRSEQERRFINMTGARSVVTVPMLKDKELIGMITVFRQEIRPFGKGQVDLLASFAAQALIAIENARLLSELRQRTADLTKSLEKTRPADSNVGGAERHLQFARRTGTGVPGHAGERDAHLRSQIRQLVASRGRQFSHCCDARRAARVPRVSAKRTGCCS